MSKVIGSHVDEKGNFRFIYYSDSVQNEIKEIFKSISAEMLSRLTDVSRDTPDDHESIESILDDIQFYIDTLKDNDTYIDYGK